MDFTTLSRIQFGVTIGFHYLFALTTLGLAFYILLLESVYLCRKDDDFRRLSDFLIKLLAIVFVFGVSTGFMMPFAFGANWSRFSTSLPCPASNIALGCRGRASGVRC